MSVCGGPGRDPLGGWEQCAALGWVLTADPSPWELTAVPQQPPETTSLLANADPGCADCCEDSFFSTQHRAEPPLLPTPQA